MRLFYYFILSLTIFTPTHAASRPFILYGLEGRLGNNLFQTAAAVSLALDHNCDVYCPDLDNPRNPIYQDYHKHILHRVSAKIPDTPPSHLYMFRRHKYVPIPYKPNMAIQGFFFSERHFKRHKKEIVKLFAPSETIKNYLQKKYPHVISHSRSVAVHLRCYYPYCKNPKSTDGKDLLHFLGAGYFRKAINRFSKKSLFLIFSDNIEYAKKILKGYRKNMIFIENEPYYHDFYLMSMCKNQITSNSTFSWWAAYLNPNPHKIVICPKRWLVPSRKTDVYDITPEGWITQ